MSASQEKKKRREQYNSGEVDKKNQDVKKKSNVKYWIIGIVCAVILVSLTIFFSLFNTGYFEKNTTALTIDSHEISPVMYNYFYGDVYQQVASQYGDMLSIFMDSETPLDEQPFPGDDTMTWYDYLTNQTMDIMKHCYAVYDQAMAAGYELTEDDIAYVESTISSMGYYGLYSQMGSTSAYLTSLYGKGSNEENFREYVELRQIVSSYSTEYASQLEYSDEEIEAFYNENRDDFDTVSYRYYLFAPATETGEGDVDIADMEEAEAKAKEMAEAVDGDEEKFKELVIEYADESVKDYYSENDATLMPDQTKSVVNETLQDWLFDESRVYGDTTYLPMGDYGYAAVFFVDNSEKNDINMANIRRIMVRPEDFDSEESIEAAQALAQKMLDEYSAGEHTAEAFDALAETYADQKVTSMGATADVFPGMLSDPMDAWCFEQTHEPGDVGIVHEDDYAYLMFFESEGMNYQKYIIDTTMRSRDTDTWAHELSDSTTVVYNNFGMRFAKP